MINHNLVQDQVSNGRFMEVKMNGQYHTGVKVGKSNLFINPLKTIVLYGKSQSAQCSGESNFFRNKSRFNANLSGSFIASSSLGYIGTLTSQADFE